MMANETVPVEMPFGNAFDLLEKVGDIDFETIFVTAYNHYAIETGKLAPQGWRIPTQQDFIELINYVASQGHSGNEATVLKSTEGWSSSIGNGTNLFGFNVKPAGTTIIGGTPDFESAIAQFATSNVNLTDNTRKIATFFENGEVQINDLDTRFGLSIRLIKE